VASSPERNPFPAHMNKTSTIQKEKRDIKKKKKKGKRLRGEEQRKKGPGEVIAHLFFPPSLSPHLAKKTRKGDLCIYT
jgi:hypothetical protein